MPGFVKIDGDIFGSSIMEEKGNTRLVWFFFLAAADRHGRVDQTHQSLARLYNLPLADVEEAIHDLEQPDEISRSPAEDGRRIVRLDKNRAWGWQIVNYEMYRNARNAEERRAYKTHHQAEKREQLREADRKYVEAGNAAIEATGGEVREAERLARQTQGIDCPQLSTGVHSCPRVDNVDRRGPMQSAEAEAEAEAEKTKSAASPPSPSSMPPEWRNLGISKAEARALVLLVEDPGTVDAAAVRASHVTDEKAMRLERLHLLAELIAVSAGYAASDTSLQLWCSWRSKARAKASPRLKADSQKDWRNEVETLRKLRERIMDRRAAIAAGELNGWRGFEWDWADRQERRKM